jgi:hypothetical protein
VATRWHINTAASGTGIIMTGAMIMTETTITTGMGRRGRA